MTDYWYVFSVLAVAGLIWRRDLRREMLWAGALALPLLVFQVIAGQALTTGMIVRNGLMIFSLGAIASALYEILLGKTLTPQRHPDRRHLWWLASGLLVFTFIFFIAGQGLITSLLIGLAVDLIVVLLVRRDLVWDAVVSGTGLALLYGSIFLATVSIAAGSVTNLVFSRETIGITFLSLPVEEILAVFIFGALWGPLYAAAKHYDQRRLADFHPIHLHPKMVVTVFVAAAVLGLTTWFVNEAVLAPAVKAVSPDRKLGRINLTDVIHVTFSRPIDRNRLAVTITPDIDGQWTFNSPSIGDHAFRSAVFTPDPAWRPGARYEIEFQNISSLLGRGDREFSYVIETQTLPEISGISLQDNLEVNTCDPITVKLDSQNNNLADFSWRLTPPADITATLSDDRLNYRLAPVGCFRPGTSYTLTAERQATVYDSDSQKVISLSDPVQVLSQTFRTVAADAQPPAEPPAPEPLTIREVFPKSGSTGVSVNTSLRVDFSAAVDQAAAEAKLSINPMTATEISWSGSTIIIKPSAPLIYDTHYDLAIASGVTSQTGQVLTSDYRWNFRTVVPTTRLSIANDLQDKPLSCEAAALKMALAGKGVKVSETDIMNVVGYDQTPHRGDTWGDPDEAFVGNISGKQNTTGYGVHWAPIERAAKKWRPESTAFAGWTVKQLAEAIAAGHPVIIWGTVGSAYYDPWRTPSGRLIKAWKGEHTRTVIGFTGTADNPKTFILNDPYVGRITWSAETLKNNWSRFDFSGVVVK